LKLQLSREWILFLLLVALLVVAGLLEPRFLTMRSQVLLASHLWELAIVAVPMLLIIMIGGIDLSIGAMVALCAVALGLLFEKGVSPFVGAFAALGAGAALGFTNGWFVAKMRVHPLIVTLATMAAFRGIAEGISLARPISGYPDSFLALSSGKLLGVPYPLLVFIGIAVAAWFVLAKMRFGRWIVAIGTEENVSRFSGIPVNRVKIILYTMSGLVCGIAATLLVARNNTAKADIGMGLELEAITAIVLGGASIDGGKGKVLGLVLGLLLIHETREFVSWHWKQSELNLIVLGALLIGTLLVERLVAKAQGQRATVGA
jgi:rhamnose transport system permease protein